MPEQQATALLALWNDVEPGVEDVYNDWHANEHVPERLRVPGILWARRYAARPGTPMQRYLTLYGLHSPAVLDSAPYRHLLANPTPVSARMRPQLRGISRWVCDIRALQGEWDGRVLFVVTGETQAQAQEQLRALDSDDSAGSLLAQRIPDAAPLPWMNEAQGQGVAGHWLAACCGEKGPTPPGCGVLVYERRPVKDAWPVRQ
ncbi:MAG: hypothetical protein JSS56_05615 [Proteobacteria bacterium]|nr:hypothetical protein [Pseudomonadota bacterium]